MSDVASNGKTDRVRVIVIVVIIAVVILVWIFLARRKNGKSIHKVFACKGGDVRIKELRQVQHNHKVPGRDMQAFRSFNPCVFESGGELLYAYRVSNVTMLNGSRDMIWQYFNPEKMYSFLAIQFPSRTIAIDLEDRRNRGRDGRRGEKLKYIAGYEDPRILIDSSPGSFRLYMICNRGSSETGYREMVVVTFDATHRQKSIVPLHFGHGNSSTKRHEKNWMPFLHVSDPDHLYFVYSVNPHVILKWNKKDKEGRCQIVAETKNSLPKGIRGGSQVILVQNCRMGGMDDLYLAVVHVKTGLNGYGTMFYAFETKEPFAVKYITEEFVFGHGNSRGSKGSYYDGDDSVVWKERGCKKKIEFASGLVEVKGKNSDDRESDDRENDDRGSDDRENDDRESNGDDDWFVVTYGEADYYSKECRIRKANVLLALCAL